MNFWQILNFSPRSPWAQASCGNGVLDLGLVTLAAHGAAMPTWALSPRRHKLLTPPLTNTLTHSKTLSFLTNRMVQNMAEVNLGVSSSFSRTNLRFQAIFAISTSSLIQNLGCWYLHVNWKEIGQTYFEAAKSVVLTRCFWRHRNPQINWSSFWVGLGVIRPVLEIGFVLLPQKAKTWKIAYISTLVTFF